MCVRSKGVWLAATFAVVIAIATGFCLGWFLAKQVLPSKKSEATWTKDLDPAITDKLFAGIQAQNIEDNLRWLTAKPRIAGSSADRQQAEQIQRLWQQQGLDDAGVESYDVLLSYPGSNCNPNKVQILDHRGEVLYETLSENQSNIPDGSVPPYVAYSPNGTAVGDVVFANYGKLEDYNILESNYSIHLTGKIVLVRSGRSTLPTKAKIAAEHQVAALIVFMDPHHVAKAGLDKVYPDTWWLPEDGAKMGTIHETGDPLTPGYPAKDFAHRLTVEEAFKDKPDILIQPVGYDTAAEIFASMDETTPSLPAAWKDWNVDTPVNFSMRIGGRMKDNRKIKVIVNNQLERRQTYNAFGIFRGSIEPDRLVIVGNHRDAWRFGAVDPGGGTAAMLELTRVLGLLKQQGWRPRRTLMFCSWGAEEFGLIGSSEFVQERLKILEHKAVVYLNLDVIVTGTTTLEARASPVLHTAIMETLRNVPHPEFASVYDAWESYMGSPSIRTGGANSDDAQFFLVAGIPSLLLYYSKPEISFYPAYHSIYDTFYYTKTFIDPTFEYHSMMAKIYGELIQKFTDKLILPFDVLRYGHHLGQETLLFMYVTMDQLKMKWFQTPKGRELLLQLDYSINNYTIMAEEFQSNIINLDMTNPYMVRQVNDQMMLVERAFIDVLWAQQMNMDYHHVLLSPSDSECSWFSWFPGINSALCDAGVKPYLTSETMPEEGFSKLQKQFAIVCHALNSATDFLLF